jgi:hypothetical protein
MRLQSRIFWLLILLLHAAGAVGWWLAMPRGFPLDHPRLWVNQVMPVGVVLVILTALWAARAQRLEVVRMVLLSLAVMWLAAAVSAAWAFSQSRALVWLAPLAIGAVTLIAAGAPRLRDARWRRWFVAPALAAAVVGALLPWSQRGPDPSTHPVDVAMLDMPVTATAGLEPPGVLRLSDSVRVQPREGLITQQRDRMLIHVEPVLTFISRSPDRCWTVFARPADRTGPRRALTAFEADDRRFLGAYQDNERHFLRVERQEDIDGAEVEAFSELPAAVYSHLNTYCEITVAGHRRLSIGFSPVSGDRFEALSAGYPVGEPARLAYLDGGGGFHVVEAASAEKGPFTTLASGRMSRGEPLWITLYDDDRPAVVIVLEDWSAQASTGLSPTAGWGLPMNAIEFGRSDARPTAPVSLFITLAGTSVGRGWGSVGHGAGVYRNRMRIELLP